MGFDFQAKETARVQTTAHQTSDVDRVRDATDLVQLIGEHVALRPRGREYLGLCPFHDDTNPSFAVVTHKGNAFYKCHACGAAGDAFRFVMDFHKMAFGDALRHLAERAGITLVPRRTPSDESSSGLEKSDLYDANRLALDFFRTTLNNPTLGRAARDALAGRQVANEMVEAFMLGAAPAGWDRLLEHVRATRQNPKLFVAAGLLKRRKSDQPGGAGAYDTFRNRLIFPICDELGRAVAFGGRQLDPDDDPKYLNSPESPVFDKSATLYGLHLAKRAIIDSGTAIVTEGYMDVIACHQVGVTNVVATLGTALTPRHAGILKRFCRRVVLLFDGDEAGQRAADRGVEVFFAQPVDVSICVLPDDLDPDDLLKQPEGAARFQSLVDGARDALDYKVDRFRSRLNAASGLSSRQAVLEAFLAELARLGFTRMPGVRKHLVLNRISELLHLPVDVISRAMPNSPLHAEAADPGQSADAPATPSSMADRAQSTPHDGDADAQSDADDRVPPAILPRRRSAERDILAVLLARPEWAAAQFDAYATAFDADESTESPAQLSADAFADPTMRSIATVVFDHLRAGRPCLMQSVLSDLGNADARRVTTMLHEFGDDRCGETEESAASLWSQVYRAYTEELRSADIAHGIRNGALSVSERIELLRTRKNNPRGLLQGLR